MKPNKEIRNNANGNLTGDVDSRNVEGYAVCFNSVSEDLGFFETIHEGAITEDTINNSDVFCRLNHDDNKILARSKNGRGSLCLEVDGKGLKYLFEAPKTATGEELLVHLKRGEIDGSSFAFTVAQDKDAEKWHRDANGTLYRDIYKIDRLYDVAPVFTPAYAQTTCSARAKDVKNEAERLDGKFAALLDEIDNLI